MGIKKVIENGKTQYEVIVKVRDKSGKQITKKKKGFTSEAAAKRAELGFKMELEGHRSKVTWAKWIERVMEKYKVEYRHSTYHNYRHCLNKWFNPLWDKKFVDEIKPSVLPDKFFHFLLSNFSLAFFLEKVQLIVTFFRLAILFQALVRLRRVSISGILLFPRLWREYMPIAISAWFNQLPCFRVKCTSKRDQILCPSSSP